MLLLPITGVTTAVLFLGERPGIKVYIGGLIILIGVGMILIGKTDKKT
jgi:drug/metabolite transporter (DMT)-like permease